jgi:hypothetical protein
MKKLLLIFICFLTLSCKKDVEVFGPIVGLNADASCKKNGKFMKASVSAKDMNLQEDFFMIAINTGEGIGVSLVRESIFCSIIEYKTGKYKVYKSLYQNELTKVVSDYNRHDDDISGDAYEINESKDNFIEITELDMVKRTAKGIFQLNFTIKDCKNKINQNAPNKVSFTEGIFETTIQQ